MQKFEAIVVGGGSGGNVGALTLQKKGQKTLLIEKHNITGGTGSSFRRGRFEFETALHQLYGITDDHRGNKGQLRQIFEELGVYDKITFVPQKETFRMAMGQQISVPVPGSHDGFTALLKHVSPQEAEAVDKLQALIDQIGDEFYDMYNVLAENGKFSRERFPAIYEYGSLTTLEVLQKFLKHPLLIAAYSTYAGYVGIPVETSPFVDMAIMYARGEGTCYPEGGSAAMSAAITDEFLSAGGTLKLGSAVTKLLVEDGKIRGVRCDDGTEYYADRILCNVNKLRVYLDLLEDSEVPEQVFDDLRVSIPSQSIFAVYLGLDCSAEEAGIVNETNFFRTAPKPGEKPARDDVRYRDDVVENGMVSCYNVDVPSSSEEGTCVVSVLVSKLPDWFLTGPIEEYYDRKDRMTESVLELFYSYYPKAKGHIEEIDAASPVTMMRYLGSMNGAIYGLDGYMKDYIANKLDVDSPIEGLYFCGASIMNGGFNTSMTSGYFAAKRMLHDAQKED